MSTDSPLVSPEIAFEVALEGLTGAALWFTLAVVCIIGPFNELADNSDLFEMLGAILGGTVAKYAVPCSLALSVSTVCERVVPDAGLIYAHGGGADRR